MRHQEELDAIETRGRQVGLIARRLSDTSPTHSLLSRPNSLLNHLPDSILTNCAYFPSASYRRFFHIPTVIMASDLDQLIEMGFDKERAQLAVTKTGGCKFLTFP